MMIPKNNISLLIFSALLCVVMLESCRKDAVHHYEYNLSGNGYRYDVTVETQPGVYKQYTSVHPGWGYAWDEVNNDTRHAYISAMNDTTNNTVTVSITRDGAVITEDSNHGPHAVATVDGTY